MTAKKYSTAEGAMLIERAAALIDSSERLDLDDEVENVRHPKRPPQGWKPPDLTVDPVWLARQSLKEAVESGLLTQSLSGPKQVREGRDEIRSLAKVARNAEASLQQLLDNLASVDELFGETSFHGLGLSHGNDLYDEIGSTLMTVAAIANASEKEAHRWGKRISHEGDLFRRGFALAMARTYYLLTGLEPPLTRKPNSRFVQFVDAAVQHVFKYNEPSCVGVLGWVVPRFKSELRDGLLNSSITKFWVSPKLWPEWRPERDADAGNVKGD